MNVIKCVPILCFLLLLSGCLTDKLVFFEEGLLTGKEMEPFLGKYDVEIWKGKKLDPKPVSAPTSVIAAEENGRYFFSYSESDQQNRKNAFLLSKIPNSKLDLFLFSAAIKEKGLITGNLFYIGRVHKGKTYLWEVMPDAAVAKGRIKVTDKERVFRSEDVKAFLEKFADAYVLANDPIIVLKKSK